MYSGIVVKDDGVWQGHPDVAYFKDRIYIAYRQSEIHLTPGPTQIMVVSGAVFNREGSVPWLGYITEPQIVASSLRRLNCPRLSVVNDMLWLICDEVDGGRSGRNRRYAGADKSYFAAENDPNRTRVFLWKSKDGEKWEGPIHTNITGIVPDRIIVSEFAYLIGTHSGDRLTQRLWHTNNLDDGNFTPYAVGDVKDLNLCEGSFFESRGHCCCLMRENSGKGRPSYLSVSEDWKEWSHPVPTRMFGCHRPVSGTLRSGNILVTYREQSHCHGRGCWGKNTFAYLIRQEDWKISAGALHRPNDFIRTDRGIILPLDHDNNQKHSDSGYTGWIQLEDDSIFVVNYITSDAPKPYIKWYLINEEDF